MLDLSGKAESFWVATLGGVVRDRAPLNGDLAVDVAIVGGGIVGLTAAELLTRAGERVSVIEASRIGQQVTGRSTAKVTSQHGLIYQRLATSFGEESARVYGTANQAGLEQIARWVDELGIFERTAAYVYSRSGEQLEAIEKEVDVRGGLACNPGATSCGARACPCAGGPCRRRPEDEAIGLFI